MHRQYPYTRETLGAGDKTSRSMSGVRRPRSDESWIEVSSAASSSSTSLHTSPRHYTHDQPRRRRRHLLRNAVSGPALITRPTSAATSSQEEYEESESESDRILTSSNEHIPSLSPAQLSSDEAPSTTPSQQEEENENGPARGIGTTNSHVFTPPANAFTHPPSYTSISNRQLQTRPLEPHLPSCSAPSASQAQRSRRQSSTSYTSTATATANNPNRRVNPGSTPHPTLPSRVDHDAALRASLSTLLSCAAAARGLPKREQEHHSQPQPQTQRSRTQHQRINARNAIQPSTLRLIHESELHAEAEPGSRRSSKERKRRASTSKERERRAKRRELSSTLAATDDNEGTALANPTLMTWALSAGVVIIFSALSFSAGYAIGREAAKLQNGVQGGSCGREAAGVGRGVGRGLRKLREVGKGIGVVSA